MAPPSESMLSPAFIDWWFKPWDYAMHAASILPLANSRLGRRDGYRLWCQQAKVKAELPAQYDPAWSMVAEVTSDALIAAARLFGGVFAARSHDRAILDALPVSDRRWCVAIAATQPLQSCIRSRMESDDGVDVHGLGELAVRLEHGFPGIWARLRLTLPPPLAEKIAQRLENAGIQHEALRRSMPRAQRCWRLCSARARSGQQ